MLYHIDQSVVDSIKKGDSKAYACLKDLGQSWKCGQCLVSASRQTLTELIETCEIDAYPLIKKYAQGVHSLYASLEFFVVLVANNAKVSVMQQYAGKYVVMDVSEYGDIKQFHNNYLICENVRDCEFYIFCTNHLFSAIIGNIYQLNILKCNGGGGTIVDVLKSYSEYSCLAICDTDRKYPNCKDGQTLEGVLNYFSTQHNRRLWMYALHVHEIENLVPLKLLEIIVRRNKLHRRRLNTLQSIQNKGLKDAFLKHFDFKKGLGEKLLRNIKENDPQFFEKCCQVLLQIGKKQHDINKAVERTKDSAPQLIDGFGDGIFAETLDYLLYNDVNSSILEREIYQQQDWNAIAKNVWSLGCAMNPRRL